MDSQDNAKTTPSPERRLKHGMTNIAPTHDIPQEAVAREVHAVPDVYPEVIRHIPGNTQKEQLPTLTGAQPLPPEITHRRVRERAQSMEMFAAGVMVYSLLSIYLYTVVHKTLEQGSGLIVLPGTVQHVALGGAVLTLALTPVLWLTRSLSAAKTVLFVQLCSYVVVFVGAFVCIVLNFVYFFSGVGLLAFASACFFLWTRSVRNDVTALPEFH